MGEQLLTIVLVAVIAVLAFALGRRRRGGGELAIHSSLEHIRDIGHLSAFKVFTKEIVTETSHDWGDIGSRYLGWILTDKKMAIVFEFEIDCRYDLRSPELSIQSGAGGAIEVRMPPCVHEVHLQNLRFYDEQHSRLLPWLLPDLLNGFFSKGFTEADKNRIVAAAKHQAERQARTLIAGFQASVEDSARRTLQALCTSLGARQVRFEFPRAEQAEVRVNFEASAAA